jgi:hypothetical protein
MFRKELGRRIMRNGAKHSPFTNFLQRNAMKAENANSEDTNSMPNPETFSRNRLVDTSIQRTVWQGSPKDSKTPVQDALKQQDVKGLSPLRQNTTLSAPWQRFVEHAHEMMFGKESSRAFSSDMLSEIKFPKEGEPSSISADQWQPKSVADLHPLKELAEALDEQNIEIWKERAEKSLGGEVAIEIIDKECRKLRNKLAHLASDYLANAKLCRRVKPDELHKILVEEQRGRVRA